MLTSRMTLGHIHAVQAALKDSAEWRKDLGELTPQPSQLI